MLDNDKLRKLSGLCGINLEYWDIWGNLHAVSEETQASVLACMGYPVNSPEDLDKALEEWKTARG